MQPIALSVAVIIGLTAKMAFAVDPATKCIALKEKTAGKYLRCLLKSEATAATRGLVADFSKCDVAFDASWARAESPGECITTGDGETVKGKLIAHAGEAVAVINDPAAPTCGSELATCETELAACGSDVPVSCKQLLDETPSGLPDGVYTIDPDGSGGAAPFQVWCDMTTDDGGWTLLITYTKDQTPIGTVDDWPETFATTGGEPDSTGMYKGTMAPFSEVREEVNSGAQKVWAKGLSAVDLNELREYYAYNDRLAHKDDWLYCRANYSDPVDNIFRCAAYPISGAFPNVPNHHTGFQWDVYTSWCWFGRGFNYESYAGSARCIGGSGGEPNGTAWSRVFFR